MSLFAERRSGYRFPLELTMTCRTLLKDAQSVFSIGPGRTVDISRTGALMDTALPFAAGQKAEFAIDWPSTLSTERLKLVVVGVVVRRDVRGTAIRILRHHFKRGGGGPLSRTGWKALGDALFDSPKVPEKSNRRRQGPPKV
jgi:hypothetical protein